MTTTTGIGAHHLARLADEALERVGEHPAPRSCCRCWPGEEVVAVVALRAGAEVTGEQLVASSRAHLSRYTSPREVRVLPSVPLTSVGKTDRKAVRGLLT